MTPAKQADKLRAVADWFTDCTMLVLESRVPTGLIAALRAGADALEQIGSGNQAPSAKEKQ